jgi:hypothetical protein
MATIAAMGLSQPVQAQNITGSTSPISAWLGTPTYETGLAPTTGNGGTSQDNDNWGGNANGTAGFGALGQSFEVSTSGTLQNVQIVMAGSAATFNVELYDLGAYPASGYPSVPQQINQLGQNGGTGVNLLQPGDSLSYQGAAGQTLQTMTFGGADANVQLVTGELYLLSLDPTANADGTWWVRGGVPSTGPGMGYNADGVNGLQNFEGKTGTGLTGIRDFDTSVTTTAVPEPCTMALLSLGALACASVRRRSK